MIEILQQHWLFLLVGDYPKGPLGGLAMTLLITITSMVLAFPCAVLVALCRTSGIRLFVWPSTAFVYLIRGTPLLMLVFWIFFAGPVILGFTLSAFATIVIAIVSFQTAYLSEVIRGGIEGLPKGQTEAARALGLGYFVTTWKVILPQALYNVIPGILNNLTAIFKESSLAYVISLHELTFAALQVMNFEMRRPFQVLVLLAAIYFCCCFALSQTASWLEVRVARKRERDSGLIQPNAQLAQA
ncbi:amino acid ABC transporter permease [Chelativorans sp. SCAU2101]|uniref:Amino acid ABC transporter permease n=1 Tax=Chelativorans petroleitrophicus TaxID=2975484 RepID=A0A9X2X9Y5_9HYPH|nr:amino acid ABC transporter permease [Chelativorans petroleitrophicus]